MALLKTNALANVMAVHSPNHLLTYEAGDVKRYRKADDNSLTLRNTYPVANVKRLAISEDGQKVVAQTATQTLRLHMPTDDPLETTGAMGISDSNHLIVLQPTAVQVIRETTVLLTATTTGDDKICCGRNSFIVYNSARTLTGTYTGFVLTNNAQGTQLLHVAHIGNDKFAYFYITGQVLVGAVGRNHKVLTGHRSIGNHIVANDGVDEYTFMRKFPQTAPVKLRPYTPPPLTNDFFTIDTGGASTIGYTTVRSIGVTVEDPATIDNGTVILPGDNQDYVEFVFDQAINLSTTDWTLEWSTLNLGVGTTGSYYGEIVLIPAATGNVNTDYGVVARYGDGGFGNRLQFGGLVSGTNNVWSAPLTKTNVNGILKRYAMVKQGTTIYVYVDGVRQNLALGTGSSYDQPNFTIDRDITAIRRVRLGATYTGGGTMPAKRGKVRLSLFARYTANYTPVPF